jgi:hypothetical protein
LKVYKILVKNKIEFEISHIFNRPKLEKEIIPKYPKFVDEINTFTSSIRLSLIIAVFLVIIITILGFIIKH